MMSTPTIDVDKHDPARSRSGNAAALRTSYSSVTSIRDNSLPGNFSGPKQLLDSPLYASSSSHRQPFQRTYNTRRLHPGNHDNETGRGIVQQANGKRLKLTSPSDEFATRRRSSVQISPDGARSLPSPEAQRRRTTRQSAATTPKPISYIDLSDDDDVEMTTAQSAQRTQLLEQERHVDPPPPPQQQHLQDQTPQGGSNIISRFFANSKADLATQPSSEGSAVLREVVVAEGKLPQASNRVLFISTSGIEVRSHGDSVDFPSEYTLAASHVDAWSYRDGAITIRMKNNVAAWGRRFHTFTLEPGSWPRIVKFHCEHREQGLFSGKIWTDTPAGDHNALQAFADAKQSPSRLHILRQLQGKSELEQPNTSAAQRSPAPRIATLEEVNRRDRAMLTDPAEVGSPTESPAANSTTAPATRTSARLAINAVVRASAGEPMLIYPGGPGSVVLYKDDLERLRPDEFLNDTIVDFYLKYNLDQQSEHIREQTYIFSSFFFSRLNKKARDGTGGGGYKAVEKWTRSKNVNLFTKRFVIVPINEDAHWYVAVLANLDNVRFQEDPTEIDDSTDSLPDEPIASRLRTSLDMSATSMGDFDEEIIFNNAMPTPINGSAARTGPRTSLSRQIQAREREGLRMDFAGDSDDNATRRLGSLSLGDPEEIASRPLRRWTKKANATIPMDKPVIIILDSLGASHAHVYKKLKTYLVEEAKAVRGKTLDPSTIKQYKADNITGQDNFSDCGIYLIHYINALLSDPQYALKDTLDREQCTDEELAQLRERRTQFWQPSKDRRAEMRREIEELADKWLKQKSDDKADIAAKQGDGAEDPPERPTGESEDAESDLSMVVEPTRMSSSHTPAGAPPSAMEAPASQELQAGQDADVLVPASRQVRSTPNDDVEAADTCPSTPPPAQAPVDRIPATPSQEAPPTQIASTDMIQPSMGSRPASAVFVIPDENTESQARAVDLQLKAYVADQLTASDGVVYDALGPGTNDPANVEVVESLLDEALLRALVKSPQPARYATPQVQSARELSLLADLSRGEARATADRYFDMHERNRSETDKSEPAEQLVDSSTAAELLARSPLPYRPRYSAKTESPADGLASAVQHDDQTARPAHTGSSPPPSNPVRQNCRLPNEEDVIIDLEDTAIESQPESEQPTPSTVNLLPQSNAEMREPSLPRVIPVLPLARAPTTLASKRFVELEHDPDKTDELTKPPTATSSPHRASSPIRPPTAAPAPVSASARVVPQSPARTKKSKKRARQSEVEALNPPQTLLADLAAGTSARQRRTRQSVVTIDDEMDCLGIS